MKIKIMKFGGTSLSDPEKIRLAAGRAAAEKKKGFAVVLVLSAPGLVTDELLELASRVTKNPDPRELDALLSCGEQLSVTLAAMSLRASGCAAISLTGAQAGILTDNSHLNARLLKVRPKRLLAELKKGRIAVVAGFQAISRSGDVTTLGRGGSDLSAVALAGELKASICELYSDVKGIYTANPALVASARKLSKISYKEVMALARAGTEVRQLKAVAYARKHRIPLLLRSSFDRESGTLVGDFRRAGKKPAVTCFSARKTKTGSEITIIGSMLNAASVMALLRRAAASAGCRLKYARCTPDRITLRTERQAGESLLCALHKVFIDQAQMRAY